MRKITFYRNISQMMCMGMAAFQSNSRFASYSVRVCVCACLSRYVFLLLVTSCTYQRSPTEVLRISKADALVTICRGCLTDWLNCLSAVGLLTAATISISFWPVLASSMPGVSINLSWLGYTPLPQSSNLSWISLVLAPEMPQVNGWKIGVEC